MRKLYHFGKGVSLRTGHLFFVTKLERISLSSGVYSL